MQEHQRRVVTEQKELDEKLNKLIEFMHTDVYAGLPSVEQGLLMVQQHDMANYSQTLIRRIELFAD